MSAALETPPRVALFETSPYATFLGVRADFDGERLTSVLPFSQHLVGNPILPALHGGVVAAFLELAALAQLSRVAPEGYRPVTVDTTVDYLRSARAHDTFARAEVLRLGRRVANVRAWAWQAEETRPVATLRGHFVITR